MLSSAKFNGSKVTKLLSLNGIFYAFIIVNQTTFFKAEMLITVLRVYSKTKRRLLIYFFHHFFFYLTTTCVLNTVDLYSTVINFF